MSCPWCDLSAYAKEGTKAHRRILAALPKPATEPPPAETQDHQPAKFKPAFA